MAKGTKSDIGFSKENTNESFVRAILGYYAWVRQRKEGKTILDYEQWYELYEPYKRINKENTNEQ